MLNSKEYINLECKIECEEIEDIIHRFKDGKSGIDGLTLGIKIKYFGKSPDC